MSDYLPTVLQGVMGFNLIWMWDREKEMTDMLETLASSVKWEKPHVGNVFPFHKAPEAMRHLQVRFASGAFLDENLTA